MRLDIRMEAEKIAQRINNPRRPVGRERAVFWFTDGPYLTGSLSASYQQSIERFGHRLVGVYTAPVDVATIAEDLGAMK